MAKSSVTEVRTTQGFDFIRELGQQLRVDSIRSSTTAGSGHPTSSMSAADLMAVLITRYFLYDWNDPQQPNNDHLIFSKGHASPLLYAIFKAVGVITDDEMLTFRKFGSRLQGHPTPALPWVDVATGSLGQGLPIAVGVALAGRKLDQLPYHVWTLTGDSELAEGSIWEGLDKAGYYGLSNCTAIFDINRLGQRGPTEPAWTGSNPSPANRRSGTPASRSRSLPIRRATRSRPARHMATRSRPWGPVRESSRWTARSATRLSRKSSPGPTPTATSRSSSPSS